MIRKMTTRIDKLEPLLNENKKLTEKVADLEAEIERCREKG